MKKITAFVLAAFMVMTLIAGCSQENVQTSGNGSGADAATQSGVDDSWTKVQSAGKLVLGLDEEFPPMGYRDTETGEIVGFDIDLATEVCKRLGLELVKTPINWDNKQLELDGGNIDCIWNGMSYTGERAQEMLVSAPYMQNKQFIITLKGSEYTTMDSLAGKILGVQKDSSAEAALDKNEAFKNTLGQIIGIENYTSAVLELQNGTIDGIAIDEIVARYYIAKEPELYQIVQDENGEEASLAQEDYVIGFRKGDVALKDKIYGTLQEMKRDGTLAKISNDWFEKDITAVE